MYTHRFSMHNALSVAVYFIEFDIPECGALWAYGAGSGRPRGPFTHMNVHPGNNGAYSIATSMGRR